MITTVNTLVFAADGTPSPAKIEVETSAGIGIHFIGIPDEAVKTSLLRVVTAMQSLGYRLPGKKIVINVAPAMRRGRWFELLDYPVFLGLVASSAAGSPDTLDEGAVYLGECRLTGAVAPLTPEQLTAVHDWLQGESTGTRIIAGGVTMQKLGGIPQRNGQNKGTGHPKCKIHLPEYIIAKWADMTERNDHTGVMFEIASFFSEADYRYKDFERLAEAFSRVMEKRDRNGGLNAEAVEERGAAYAELKALIIEGYGEEVWKMLP